MSTTATTPAARHEGPTIREPLASFSSTSPSSSCSSSSSSSSSSPFSYDTPAPVAAAPVAAVPVAAAPVAAAPADSFPKEHLELEVQVQSQFQLLWAVFQSHSTAEDEVIWPALKEKARSSGGKVRRAVSQGDSVYAQRGRVGGACLFSFEEKGDRLTRALERLSFCA